MTWRKYFTPVDNAGLPVSTQGSRNSGNQSFAANQDSNYLPEIYAGSPHRILRYGQYDIMDQDPEINQALDTIAEFGTQDDEYTELPFIVKYVDEPGSTESEIIRKTLSSWVELNELDRRIFRIFRNVLKYGDQFFLRDPETYELYWVDPAQVEKVIVNESEGKEIEYYYIKNIDPNFREYIATDISPIHTRSAYDGVAGINATRAYTTADAQGQGAMEGQPIGAQHMVHVSLTEGMDLNWPFGTSILDPIYKTYRQKELLEDSVIIYRLHRAPERRVFFVDVGNMPPHKARQYLEQVKNEVKQKRIPSLNSQGQHISDSIHNPMGMLEDYFFAQTADGRGSRVDTLAGGENLGEIDDLKYFNNKLLRGLRIPSSYLPTGPEDGTAQYNDGKVGVAYIQEYRFSKYVERLQRQIERMLDYEFKMYLKHKGFEIDSGNFKLQFTEPQNFSSYRDIQLNSERLGVLGQAVGIPFMSRKFALKKFMQFSEDEIKENEAMWAAENGEDNVPGEESVAGLKNMNVRPDADIDIDADIDMDDDMAGDLDIPDPGAAGDLMPDTPPPGGGAGGAGGGMPSL